MKAINNAHEKVFSDFLKDVSRKFFVVPFLLASLTTQPSSFESLRGPCFFYTFQVMKAKAL